MTDDPHRRAQDLLTYGEVMARLYERYQQGGSVKGWQAYAGGTPVCAGAAFLPTAPGRDTLLIARNGIMQCHLSFRATDSEAPLLFAIDVQPSTVRCEQ